MKDKTFEFIKHSIEDAQELFYGQTMTQEQYDAIDDMWEVFRHTYRPCYSHMEHMREIRTEEELLARIHSTAEEIDVAKESANFVAIPDNSISKRFALKKYLGIGVDDERPSTIPAHPDSIVDEYNVTYHTNKGKGSLIEKLPDDPLNGWKIEETTDYTAWHPDLEEEILKHIHIEMYDDAMKVIK